MGAVPTRLRQLLDRLPPRLRGAVDLGVATVRDAGHDRVTGLAAEIAFWVLLSLPPLLLSATAAAGLIGRSIGSDVRSQLIGRIEELALQVFSEATVDSAIRPTLDGLLSSGSTSILSVSFLVTVYSASRVLRVIIHAVAVAYDLEDSQPSWATRVMGIGYTLIGLVSGLVLIPLVVAGPRLGEILERRTGVSLLLGEIWRLAYWPVAFTVVTLLVAALFHHATPWDTPFRRDLPGAVLATVLGLLASVGLRTYTGASFAGDPVYASLAAPLALLVWIWLLAISLLLGAELNAEIERADPVGAGVTERPSLAEVDRRAMAGAKGLAGDRKG